MFSLEAYLKLYSHILVGGIFTFFVLACLILSGFYAAKLVQVGMKLINRHFERRMRSGQIAKKLKKAKAAVSKVLSFKIEKQAAKNGKGETK